MTLEGARRKGLAILGSSVGLIVILLGSSLAIIPSPAYADEVACIDGDRQSAKDIAKQGDVVDVLSESTIPEKSDDSYELIPSFLPEKTTFKLRYSERYQCAWTLIEGAPTDVGWIDRTEDGAISRDGPLGIRELTGLNTRNSHSAAYKTYDSVSKTLYDVRACGRGHIETLTPGNSPGDTPETGMDQGPIVCTDWFPTDWTVVDEFTAPDGSSLPLRIGKSKYMAPRRGNGFGVRHIEDDKAFGRQPTRDEIQDTLNACEPGEYTPGTNVTCRFNGVRVAYSERIDDYGGRVVGIVTAFIE